MSPSAMISGLSKAWKWGLVWNVELRETFVIFFDDLKQYVVNYFMKLCEV